MPVLQPAAFAHHIERFNSMEDENVTNLISNAESWNWLQQNIPLFECPDSNVEEIYYFRWWSFRKHLVKTPNGFVFTEFLTLVNHAGAYNTISCAASFHIAEGRWLRDPEFVNDYIAFWLRGNHGKPQPHFHKFSSWFADAVYQRFLVDADRKFAVRYLNDLVRDYETWEAERQLSNGLFWQFDVRDGMEESISGSRRQKNIRPTINSYMFANARAISEIARLAGKDNLARAFEAKAARLQQLIQEKLWNPDANFFEVRREDGSFANVREELGFIPWMFELPSLNWCEDTTIAWKQLADPEGFAAPFGITTAERRHPQFRSHGVGTCEWDGAVWPFATSQTLNALANVLRDYNQTILSRRDYFDAFLTYVRSQHQAGKPFIGEYLDEVTGDWINGKNGRSRYYNHSTFADLLITGVVGLRPRADDVVEVWPLLPEGVWDWFCLDGVKYHGCTLTILWDKTGTHYKRGQGLSVLCDGKVIAQNEFLQRLTGKLP
ncbi:MAG TPA: glycosyl hydrolase family 65 protein [Verrucomicrobiae bacterium]